MIDYIFRYLQDSPPWQFVLLWLACLLTAVALRYGWGVTPPLNGLFYAVPYLGTLLLYSLVAREWKFWLSGGFWGLSVGILLVLYLNQFVSFSKIIGLETEPNTQYFWHKLGYNLQCACLYLLIPLLYGAWAGELKADNFYGCGVGKAKLSPYFLMLLGMLPLLVWASFQESFLLAYPRYRPAMAENYWKISAWWTVGSYEISYVLQFLSLEVFFRGFMVFALYRYVGSAGVLVMVSVYAFLHFWKPMPETLGSIAGGFLLGTFALYSRSVFGGMIVHVGIALLMEILAWWQLYSKGRL
ncbi:MAG: hypothetical protein EAZ95_06610 [Bacteroidetes bacterium]|nr:MAG: hypothetical protein EAZ95_06610 [Bacteroidota bacterium]